MEIKKNSPLYSIPEFILKKIIQQSLEEDIALADLTSSLLISQDTEAKAQVIVREQAILCGLPLVKMVFSFIDPSVECLFFSEDGREVGKNTPVMEISGKAQSLLLGERVALNFLSHLCGVSTLTSQFVQAVKGTKTRILDTRKTLPGLRMLQKYAVICGGGANHRFSLGDHILIKDNHIALLKKKHGAGWLEWIKSQLGGVRCQKPFIKVEIEASSLEEVSLFCELSPDIIMLDNMDVEEIARALEIIGNKTLVEVSGRVDKEKLTAVSRLGVDFISLGLLTHSARAIDVSMDIV
ncbi:carboxylating nicotinate-nucleotide diphosphorylase [Candidatus Methylacidiphilum infernorum]|uniref:Probable nicotinate-nucleotide pyrophosphorylase [carboxylating] n=1 Tax=Methylacidiphilum infernorum (isolate V4) TaxID=481448 RepID=B3E0Y9_METI4|nr:carboxylating nicotinate-nucleotide diphosphorylase [Candidatus Methylacidiphilum infernorum]ACD84466.1 Nicotinate-nucleotide pyrophosphorylase [Methylacidiphilum infernorum V4]